MNKDYGPREQFGLFNNDYKKGPKHPDKTGTFRMSREFLKALVNMVKVGHEPELRLAAWVNENVPGKKDNIRVFLSIKNYERVLGGGQEDTRSYGEKAGAAEAQASFDDGDDMPW